MTCFRTITIIVERPCKEPCCVVDGFCLAPANLEPMIQPRSECFACGRKVCVNCSVVTRYYNYGKKRICHNCLSDNDKEELAIKHLNKIAEA
jgi:hypothetical protein